MLNIVVVEDYDLLREELVHYLHRPQWQVTGLADGAALDRHLSAHSVDVAVLDLNLPDEDGLNIAQRLRQHWPHLVIVMFTARDAAAQRAKGFMAGADVYLTKPAQTREIESIIGNIERRLNANTKSASINTSPLIVEHEVELHTTQSELRLPNGQALQLTRTETQLLVVLAQQQNQPINTCDLCSALGSQQDLSIDAASLRVRISRLRDKWHAAGGQGELVQAVRGTGYRLANAIRLCS
jgi:DNA-binding response OmpR family regulator